MGVSLAYGKDISTLDKKNPSVKLKVQSARKGSEKPRLARGFDFSIKKCPQTPLYFLKIDCRKKVHIAFATLHAYQSQLRENH